MALGMVRSQGCSLGLCLASERPVCCIDGGPVGDMCAVVQTREANAAHAGRRLTLKPHVETCASLHLGPHLYTSLFRNSVAGLCTRNTLMAVAHELNLVIWLWQEGSGRHRQWRWKFCSARSLAHQHRNDISSASASAIGKINER